jgi:hypothetical protein
MKRCYKATKRTGQRVTTLMEYGTPHAVFAAEDKQFKAACERAGVKATRRQGRGKAYAERGI